MGFANASVQTVKKKEGRTRHETFREREMNSDTVESEKLSRKNQ